jgi:hypothetical protein
MFKSAISGVIDMCMSSEILTDAVFYFTNVDYIFSSSVHIMYVLNRDGARGSVVG